MKNRTMKMILLAVIGLLVMAFFLFDLGQYFTLEYLKSQQQGFNDFYLQNKLLTLGIYFFIYVAVTALSLPGAAVMTLAGGALFGFWAALIVVSFASSIGATLAFLVSRFLLRDWVQGKFGDKLQAINRGVEKEGAFYLFSLRLVPLFPFFVINLVMGLTPLKTSLFYIVSQIGMFAGTVVYVNAGTQLGQLESAAGILSPGIIFSFVLLGIFPLVTKKILGIFQARKVYAGYQRPQKFDYNLVVLGAGSAGLVSSYIAAAVKAKVALIEKHKMGGDCLNTGCVPSKALIRSAKMLSYAKRAKEFGFEKAEVEFDFARVMERVQQVVEKVEPHDSVERYTGLGVEVIAGEAKITSPWTVEVNGQVLTSRSIIIATGARPFVPPIKGLDQVEYLTSDNLWGLRELPEKLVVLGGGPIGSELTQAFARLGSQVTQVEMLPRILSREDPEVSAFVQEKFVSEGITVLTGHAAKEVQVAEGRQVLVCEHRGETVEIEFSHLLVAVGRKANVTGFGLEELGVELNKNGTVAVDLLLATNYPNIYCAGDVAGPYQFTHTASHQAWYASVNALFSGFKSFKVDYRVIPWATFTDAEVARVGLNEFEATEQKVPFEVTRYGIDDLDRAIADSEDHGWVKVLTRPGTDKILGVTIVGTHAGDLLAEYVLAMKHNLGLNKILGTIHTYPTLAEANKMTAGIWKKEHAPEKLLQWVEKFHAWRRG
ncbi:Pyruvate/2-oxoglutarate dehydrogenase complex, dihydrolipoamide dehydrogenase (E3) component [Malonomonas rubra DSM 5091]|uniref:Pyruvate/2-oxoglutarate dehydrogenase complex, dihydrolipoamide dehydrogenase (E3) component n=1 Tax=Malonomonas rubra DSM 5091 TaxID=1122189 RepID=A0A1M6JDR5_MALRU|nr:FAD-dependent oxidoreductase [Malonomonas rubra]SHJ44732.1 Pyruvate/2-oxoglutarate dehydrogenase complex, dihydrolipoamide dehydrogenase (E3) component [Malonomonas rubra DSM 5091]